MVEVDLNISLELELLQEELKNNELLFTQIKDHYDAISQSRGTGTLAFIQNQTANLISIKSNRLSIIQQIINTKKIEAETKLKVINANKDGNSNSEALAQMASSMYDLILTNKGDKSFEEIMNQKKAPEMHDQTLEDIDALLEARLSKEEPMEDISNEEKVIDNEPVYSFVVDLNENVYCIDEEYNLIEDRKLPAGIKIVIVTDEEDGEPKAFDQHGKEYEVVEFSEDE